MTNEHTWETQQSYEHVLACYREHNIVHDYY